VKGQILMHQASRPPAHAVRGFGIALAALFAAASAAAQSGVSDDRVSLPDGPGSIGGVGENVNVVGNMGAMSFAVPFRVPAGFAHVTPELGLHYSSTDGSGIIGIGWSMNVPSIERMTVRGLPAYEPDDAFVVDGSEQLVRVGNSATDATYRARFERNFARYTWHGVADGKGGYFTAEYPDGSVGYFGADRNGSLVPSARVTHPEGGGVFRYQLVEMVDPHGNRLHYSYTLRNGYPLLDGVDYVHDAAGRPRFSARMVYGARPDVQSDCKPGFELVLDQRLTSVRIFSGNEQIRQYDLAYESEAVSGGMTRLAGVTERGRGGVAYPIRPSFAYSQTLGGACTSNCQAPFVVDMGTLPGGVDLQAGTATLLDINGDALPDVLDTRDGVHRFFLSRPSSDGRPSFAPSAVTSARATTAFQLTSPAVQLMDVNGDGFTDLISARTGGVLCNDGSGDWKTSGCFEGASFGIDLEDDANDVGFGDPLHVRFFDYDNDKRIDFLRTTSANATDVRYDSGAGFTQVEVTPIGEQFDDSALQLADMNGDGLLDPVLLASNDTLRFRLNYGYGRWSAWRTITIAGLSLADVPGARLEDLNGDGLDDLLVVNATSLKVLLNRNADRFEAVPLGNVNGTIPEKSATTTVLVADMNANGSEDVVWVSNSGRVQFLDLFPVKPNLLARIENGIGMVQEVRYGTSLAELARDGNWAYRLSYAMNVVKRVDQWVTLTGSDSGGLHDVVEYSYRDGYYDGPEKQFRGFAGVEQRMLGDALDSQQPGVTRSEYDVGKDDPYRNGLLLRADTLAIDGTSEVPLRSTLSRYGDCGVAGVPASGLAQPVRHLCMTEKLEVDQEGAPESEWATQKTTYAYDGYGNVTLESELGVDHMGPADGSGACRPCAGDDDGACGDSCGGDELYTVTEFVVPGSATGNAWFLSKPTRVAVYGADGGATRETLFYYDGDAFTGLPTGRLERGLVSRERQRVSSADGDFIERARRSHDAHGNVLVALDPLGSPDDDTQHQTRYTYESAYGLNLTATERAVDAAHALRREYSYEAPFNQVSESTAWMTVSGPGGAATSSRDARRYRYDEFGRISKLVEPGFSEAAPTFAYGYELASPVSRVVVEGRSAVDGPVDSAAYQCLDGRARTVQMLAKLADGRYLADGFRTYNSRGAVVRSYQPFEVGSASCATSAPDDVAFVATKLDPLGRVLALTHPDAALYGAASVERFEHLPLAERHFDQEDTASASPYADTPTTRHVDGFGRLVAVERAIAGTTSITRVRHDSLGRVRGYVDAAGNARTQEHDLLDRVVSVDDPNSGRTTFAYDAASNLTRRETAAGDVVRYAYDGLNRTRELWSEADRDGTLASYVYDTLDGCKACSNVAGELAEVRYPVRLGDAVDQGFDQFGYDARRRRVYAARSLEGHLFEHSYDYDGLDRLVATHYPDGRVLTRSYDGMNRLVSLSGVVDEIAYDARGHVAHELLANGTRTAYAYDDLERLSAQSLSAADDDTVYALSFERDRVGNLTVGSDAPHAGHLARAFTYGYDAWYRLTSSTLAQGGDDEEAVTQKFDAIDNLTGRSATAGSRANQGSIAYDDAHPNAASSLGAVTYGYSADGDLTARGELTLGWDYQGRLHAASYADEVVGLFAYGPREERVLKDELGHVTYYVSPEFEVRDGVAVVYPRLGQRRFARIEDRSYANRVLEDRDGDAAIRVSDAVLAQLAGEDADAPRLLAASAKRVLLDADETITFLHQDSIDNVIVATDNAGAVSAERAFYDHGDERVATAFVDEHGFGGQEHDQSTGLLHYGFRQLDPELGRWVSSDPAFEIVDEESFESVAEATNPYVYASNQYANSIDPTGLKATKAKSNIRNAHRRKSATLAELRQAKARAQQRADKRQQKIEKAVAQRAKDAQQGGFFASVGKAIFPHAGKTAYERTPVIKDREAHKLTHQGKFDAGGEGRSGYRREEQIKADQTAKEMRDLKVDIGVLETSHLAGTRTHSQVGKQAVAVIAAVGAAAAGLTAALVVVMDDSDDAPSPTGSK
jgi:RHS repeat-associated protein